MIFFGLPGLIVFLEGSPYTYKMTKVNFLNDEVLLLKPDSKAIRVSREEYNSLNKTSHRNKPFIAN